MLEQKDPHPLGIYRNIKQKPVTGLRILAGEARDDFLHTSQSHNISVGAGTSRQRHKTTEQTIFQPTTIAIAMNLEEEEANSKQEDAMSIASFIQSLRDNADDDFLAMADDGDLESRGGSSRRSTSTEDWGTSSIGKEETKWIERSKSMIICIVGLAMSIASFSVHDYTNREAEKIFRERVRNAQAQQRRRQ